MKKTILAVIFLSGSIMAQADTLQYEGSSTVGKYISDAAQVYKPVQFKLNTVPESAGGEQCAMRGQCDLGGVAREVDPRFLEQGVQAVLFAKDAIAAIVNPKNTVRELSGEQLKGIFTGKISNWSQVGGPDLAIRPLVVKEASATRHVFAKAILQGEEYQGVDVITPDAKIIAEVARDPGAIGQLSFAFLQGYSEKVVPVSVDGQAASVENPDYPITRPLHLVTHGEPEGAVKAFIDWTLSPEGQAIVKKRFIGVR